MYLNEYQKLNNMEEISKPSIIRLVRRAGIKSISDDSVPIIKSIIDHKIRQILNTAIIVNSEHKTKTLMASHIYHGFELQGEYIVQSNVLNGTNSSK